MVWFSPNFKTVMNIIIEDDMKTFDLKDIFISIQRNCDAFKEVMPNIIKSLEKKIQMNLVKELKRILEL